MPFDKKLRQQIERALQTQDDATGRRLVDDAARLWGRVEKLIKIGLVGEHVDHDALELAAWAMQLPLREPKLLARGRLVKTSLKDRAEQAAELLVSLLGDAIDESLLDRATRVLHEVPHRTPVLDEGKLLADAVNLEDFGAIGLVQQAIELSRHGDGVTQVADGIDKREQYGYWDARLKDGFHFEPVRQMARRRVEHSRQVAALLRRELDEDAA